MNTILAVTYAFFLSYMPYDNFATTKGVQYITDPTHVGYELGLDIFDCVQLYTGEETWQIVESTTCWRPYRQSYYLGAEFHKKFSDSVELNVGIKHLCSHPVTSWERTQDIDEQAYTKMYIGVKGRFDIWRK